MIEKDQEDDSPENPGLVILGKAVSDGVPVDWEGVRLETPDAGVLIENLRFVETVVAAHRQIAEELTKE